MNTEVSFFSDEALVQQYRDSSDVLIDELVIRYLPLIKFKAKSISGKNNDIEDLVQEGLIALFNAVRGFSIENNTSFRTYANHCITNKIISAVKTGSALKNLPMNNYLSLDENTVEVRLDNEENRKNDPQEIFIKMEDISLREKRLKSLLTDFEKETLRLYLSGHSYQEISFILDCSFKAVDNALQRVKKKLRNS